MRLETIRQTLKRAPPEAVRRVLPKEYIADHIRQYLRDMQTMMQSFQAVLTFPTGGRNLPQLVMQKMHKQFKHDLNEQGAKIDGEVKTLLAQVKAEKILQTYIMLDLISDTPFPFCMLNEITYSPIDNRSPSGRLYIQGYVILWAHQPAKDQPVNVWLELAPKNPKDLGRIPANEFKSKPEILRLPSGQAEFHAFDTSVSVILYGEPDEDEAFLSGKSVDAIKAEQAHLRSSLLRKHNQEGDFIHIIWAHHEEEVVDTSAISWV